MTESWQPLERRSEPRRVVAARRVSWAREDATRTCTGWVSDVATSSVAFVTPTRDRPAPGEAIVLTLDAGGRSPRHHSVRVVRTEPHDRLFSLVACRTEATEQRAHAIC